MVHPAFLYLPGHRLALPELSAARLDGHVVEMGEGYIPADLVEGPDVRAASLASLLPRDTSASGPTAAWIHGAGDRPPSRHHVHRAVAHRLRPPQDARIVFHDVFVPASDRTLAGGVSVTTPVRTLCDLALALHRDPALLPCLRSLATLAPGLLGDAHERIVCAGRVPGARRALSTLQRLVVLHATALRSEDQDEVTRYTS